MSGNRFKADPSDRIIVVMGPTGSGKSNFINALTGNTERRKQGSLKSDTQDVTPYTVSYHGLRLVLVDTPGFDDTCRPDSDILRVIAKWLTQKYKSSSATLNISGIIYLHRITDNRMSGSVYKNLRMFGRLCGDVPLSRARLVTTMWDKVKGDVGTSRETQLTGDFWRKLIAAGAKDRRFDNTRDCAWGIVNELVDTGKSGQGGLLLLQEELVEQSKHLNETEAAKILYSHTQHLLAEQKTILKELAEGAKLSDDPDLAGALQKEYDKINAQLQKSVEEMKVLKIPLSRRILLWLPVYGRKSRAQAVRFD